MGCSLLIEDLGYLYSIQEIPSLTGMLHPAIRRASHRHREERSRMDDVPKPAWFSRIGLICIKFIVNTNLS